jgi:hypothetical protein
MAMIFGFGLSGVRMNSISAEESGLVNVNPDPSGEPWIAGGITEQEWEQMTAGLPSLKEAIPGGFGKAAATPTPSRVDNSILPAFRPVFNQKGGSCAMASSIGYVFTYEMNTLRGLASDVLENQYPYDFSYNFCNSGSGSNGSNPSQGYDIAQLCGIPDAKTYGGFGLGKYTQWISGYDKYYAGMANRSLSQFSIKVNTTAGITQMRQWFNDHGTGSENGGCLVFCYNSSGSSIVSLASGTPEAGKKALVKFGTTGGHAVTITGYDDSVRYDYNNDGKYTNDIDINNDGAVNIKDWEIGAVIMVNSWGTSFGNSGKIYVPYRMGADAGGFWSNLVYGMQVGDAVAKPKITYKIALSHDNRSLIRVRAGYANNGSATAATGTSISFGKAFNYAGGAFPMQGINSDPIEFGLDVSRFASNLTTSTATFFLIIDSRGGTGTVQKFSLLDYTNGTPPVETVCSEQNIDIPAGTTSAVKTLTLKIVKTLGQVNVIPLDGSLVSSPRITRSGSTLLFSNTGNMARIFAMNGSLVAKRHLDAAGILNVSVLPRGVYLAKSGKAMLKFVR